MCVIIIITCPRCYGAGWYYGTATTSRIRCELCYGAGSGALNMTMRVIWNYLGHNGGIFERGPNWFQITIPPSRKRRRVALIVSWSHR
jgi:hypothetical protein